MKEQILLEASIFNSKLKAILGQEFELDVSIDNLPHRDMEEIAGKKTKEHKIVFQNTNGLSFSITDNYLPF